MISVHIVAFPACTMFNCSTNTFFMRYELYIIIIIHNKMNDPIIYATHAICIKPYKHFKVLRTWSWVENIQNHLSLLELKEIKEAENQSVGVYVVKG